MSPGPKSPQEYSDGYGQPEWPDDAALDEDGKAAGLDVWEQVTKAYERYIQDGELANAQLWSLREAIRREVREEAGS